MIADRGQSQDAIFGGRGCGLASIRGLVARGTGPGAGSTPICRRRPWRRLPRVGGERTELRPRALTPCACPLAANLVLLLTLRTRPIVHVCTATVPLKGWHTFASQTQQKWVRAAARGCPSCCRVSPAHHVPPANRALAIACLSSRRFPHPCPARGRAEGDAHHHAALQDQPGPARPGQRQH